jgi:integrase
MEATGKRRGSIVGLQWQDFDFATRRVTWWPEHDKKRKTWVVPYPADFFETVREFQRRLDDDVLKVTSETNKRRELVPMSVSAAN